MRRRTLNPSAVLYGGSASLLTSTSHADEVDGAAEEGGETPTETRRDVKGLRIGAR